MVDAGVGRAAVRRDRHHASTRLLEVDGHVYGAVDLAEPRRLALDYLVRMARVVEALVPAGPCDLVHLGGGAFALPRALAARRPEVTQVVIERSGALIDLARRELGLTPDRALRVVEGDAREVLCDQPDHSADAVVGDAFVGVETPRHLATSEFVADVARVLRPRGAYVVNLVDAPPWPVLAAHAGTVRTALPHLVAVGAPGVALLQTSGNVLLVGARRPLHLATLAQRLAGGDRPSALVPAGRLAALADGARPRHDADG